mmetsp:Transcript_17365/g.31331  ORF Transcript_17365/g.31331 Transcript_17365/m.31331 type:complete len:486 (+) Transcript_17365:3077-4534(+)
MSMLEDYAISRKIGSGTFGNVKLARHIPTGRQVAIKVMNKQLIKRQHMSEKVHREIRLLKLFRHPNIIRVYELVNSPANYYLVMEYVAGGDIYSLLERRGKMSEQEVRGYFHQIVAGIEYCHYHRVTHRDIKPENLLLDDENNVKIADFGLVNLMKDGEFCKTSCGSPNYAAPEVINGNKYCGPEVDVWSIGVVTYALLAGVLPFDEPSIPSLFAKIRSASFRIPRHFSPLARDLIERMLSPDPVARITLSQVKEHPWYLLDLPSYIMAAELCAPLIPEVSIFKADKNLNSIDEEIFTECLSLECFKNRTNEVTDFRQKLSDHKDGAFTASYEILLVEKYKRVKHSMEECLVVPQPIFNAKKVLGHVEFTSPQISYADIESSTEPDLLELTQPIQPRDWTIGFRLDKNITGMLDVLTSSLVELGLKWKEINDLHLRVRGKSEATTVKFDILIYKLDSTFVLDFLYRSGGAMPFLDVCAKLRRTLV